MEWGEGGSRPRVVDGHATHTIARGAHAHVRHSLSQFNRTHTHAHPKYHNTGIGPYSAGAIASIAHGTRAGMVDGNVHR